MRFLCAISLAVLMGLAACGGDDGGGDNAKPEQVVRNYLVAATQGDSERACDQLTPAASTTVTQQSGVKSCKEAFDRLASQVTDQAKEKAKTTKLTTQETGNTAKVTYDQPAGGGQNTITLTKQDGEWKISDTSSSR